MNITYIGDFSKHYRTEVWVQKSLKALGHNITTVQEKNATPKILKNDTDVLLFSKANHVDNFEKILNEAKERDIFTACWIYDLYWGTPREHEVRHHPRFKADVVFSTDGGHDIEWKNACINHVLLRQGVFQGEAKIGKKKDEFKEDIVFVGCNNSWWDYRNKVMKFLKDTYGDKFGWYGRNKQIRGMDLNDLFASTKIVIGDSVYSQKYWSNRVYETIGRGGFLIHPKVAHLEREFKYYKHLIPYDPGNLRQLKEIIDHYLTHDKEREQIKRNGFNFCKQNYTYEKRCNQLIYNINVQKRNKKNKEGYFRETNTAKQGKHNSSGDRGKVCSEKEASDSKQKGSGAGPGKYTTTDKGKKGKKEVLQGGTEKITTILLNYERPRNVHRIIKELKQQADVDMDIWLWDSSGDNEEFDCHTFRDPVNPGVFARWELARMAQTDYVLFADDDIHLKDKYVVRDILKEKKKHDPNVIVGWRGVRQLVPMQDYPDCFHTWSKHSDEDQGANIIKGQIFMIDKRYLEKSRSFPMDITRKIDSRAHGEIFYGLHWGNNESNHIVLACLRDRLENVMDKDKKGLEFRGDHYFKQKSHWRYCYNKEYED